MILGRMANIYPRIVSSLTGPSSTVFKEVNTETLRTSPGSSDTLQGGVLLNHSIKIPRRVL